MFPDRRCRTYVNSKQCLFCPRRATWILESGEQYCSRCRDLAVEYLTAIVAGEDEQTGEEQ